MPGKKRRRFDIRRRQKRRIERLKIKTSFHDAKNKVKSRIKRLEIDIKKMAESPNYPAVGKVKQIMAGMDDLSLLINNFRLQRFKWVPEAPNQEIISNEFREKFQNIVKKYEGLRKKQHMMIYRKRP